MKIRMGKRAKLDPALIDLKLLQMFDVLYTTGSVSRTADELDQSQPTVSIWLAGLRQRLRDPLFVRTPEGMQPTPRADELIGAARQILDSVRQLSAWEAVFSPATAQRRFRICMTDASHVTLLPQLLAHLRSAAPLVRLEVAGIDSATGKALQSGEADLAIGYVPWLDSGIYQQTLYPQDWVCLASGRHPRLRTSLSLSDFEREAHVNIASGTGQQLLDAAVARRGIRRNVRLELPGFLGLGSIVSTTDFVATLPRHIGETLAESNGLRAFPCPFPISGFNVKQHWHERYHQDAGNRWLRGTCAALFRQTMVRGADNARPAMVRKR
jgi:DNA-binding transcriptional LysR family regulator